MLPMLLWLACNPNVTVAVDQETIQTAVERAFPIRKGTSGFVEVVLRDPEVRLPGKALVGLDVDIDVLVHGVPVGEPPGAVAGPAEGVEDGAPAARALTGRVGLLGRLDYERSTGSFVLRQAEIDRLAVDGMTPQHAAAVKTIVSAAVKGSLDRYPVYGLDEGAAADLARRSLRDARAEEGAILLTFGR